MNKTPLTPEQRSLRARIGAHAQHAKHDPLETTAAARHASQVLRFERQVDPDGILSPGERTRRALAARRQYMATLSLKRSQHAAERRALLEAQAQEQPIVHS